MPAYLSPLSPSLPPLTFVSFAHTPLVGSSLWPFLLQAPHAHAPLILLHVTPLALFVCFTHAHYTHTLHTHDVFAPLQAACTHTTRGSAGMPPACFGTCWAGGLPPHRGRPSPLYLLSSLLYLSPPILPSFIKAFAFQGGNVWHFLTNGLPSVLRLWWSGVVTRHSLLPTACVV